MKIKTQDLIGAALDWAVAKCEGLLDPVHGEPQPRVVFYSDQWARYMRLNPPPQVYYSDRYEPSTSWAQGGPIIGREDINVGRLTRSEVTESGDEIYRKDGWTAYTTVSAFWMTPARQYGPAPLVAVMRCLVQSKLGDEVDVPDELLS